ncbi:hypothetical protein [Sulfuricurvum sp.]|uniref:hypothetical protein n=1 Tax=Sulfuricurvum sp. TaxID=2025608 RepID=UPI003562316B
MASIGCNKECKMWLYCNRIYGTNYPPCANNKVPAQKADNTTQAAIALLRKIGNDHIRDGIAWKKFDDALTEIGQQSAVR